MDTHLKPGDPHYRAYVGDPRNYDLIAAICFNLLTTMGLREQHRVLDVGCGSLRNGRLLIPYLHCGHYVGIEPNRWLVEEGIARETGADLIRIKQPAFHFRADAETLAPDARFDFILLQSIFSHCGEDLVRQWLTELTPHLAQDGCMLATWFMGRENSGERGWLYPGLVRFREATLIDLVSAAGLRYHPLDWPHPIQRWALLSASAVPVAWAEETRLLYQRAFKKMYTGNKGSA